ncbi:MAG: mannose-1-phosphate guanylyltransferase/mannose-6-phosphate isomerase [Magnetovibrionaceae bacterium]
MSIIPVVLSGGSGTRLWPLSRELYPKQLLPLVSEESLLKETCRRVWGGAFQAPLVICNTEHRFIVAEQIRETGIEPGEIVLEPVGRNTAPAVAVAALIARQRDPDASILILPSDHVIRDLDAFHGAVDLAARAAENGALVTFGIEPDGPETGYGYIKCGAPLADAPGVFEVARFAEKPDLNTAQAMLAEGGYSWNAGMFLFRAERYLEELGRLHPGMLRACEAAVEGGRRDLDFMRLDEEAFHACPSDSIDYAVMEQTRSAAVVPVEMGWNDVGSWSALWDLAEKDEAGNGLIGDVIAEDVGSSYLRTEGPLIAAVGIENLVVVATQDAVMVAPRDRAQEVKSLVLRLKANERDERVSHTRVHRPWGWYQSTDADNGFQVKRLCVKPGAKLSLQYHHHRAEHWVVVSGTAKVQRGTEEMILSRNESTYIPLGEKHRLENPGSVPLHIIEVQSGEYLGEDDIVRLEDDFSRIGN